MGEGQSKAAAAEKRARAKERDPSGGRDLEDKDLAELAERCVPKALRKDKTPRVGESKTPRGAPPPGTVPRASEPVLTPLPCQSDGSPDKQQEASALMRSDSHIVRAPAISEQPQPLVRSNSSYIMAAAPVQHTLVRSNSSIVVPSDQDMRNLARSDSHVIGLRAAQAQNHMGHSSSVVTKRSPSALQQAPSFLAPSAGAGQSSLVGLTQASASAPPLPPPPATGKHAPTGLIQSSAMVPTVPSFLSPRAAPGQSSPIGLTQSSAILPAIGPYRKAPELARMPELQPSQAQQPASQQAPELARMPGLQPSQAQQPAPQQALQPKASPPQSLQTMASTVSSVSSGSSVRIQNPSKSIPASTLAVGAAGAPNLTWPAWVGNVPSPARQEVLQTKQASPQPFPTDAKGAPPISQKGSTMVYEVCTSPEERDSSSQSSSQVSKGPDVMVSPMLSTRQVPSPDVMVTPRLSGGQFPLTQNITMQTPRPLVTSRTATPLATNRRSPRSLVVSPQAATPGRVPPFVSSLPNNLASSKKNTLPPEDFSRLSNMSLNHQELHRLEQQLEILFKGAGDVDWSSNVVSV